MEPTQTLLALARAYSAHTGITFHAIGRDSCGQPKLIKRIEAGMDCHSRHCWLATKWLAENWPDGLAWPDGVERPRSEAQSERAA